MRESGVVKKLDGRRMEVRMDTVRPELCAKCRACDLLGGGKEMVLRVSAVEGLQVGDRVSVEVPQASPWLGIVLVLGLPVALMVGGLVLGSRWTGWVELLGLDADVCGALLGVPLGVAAFLVARAVDRRYAGRVAVERMAPGAGPSEDSPA